MSTIHFSRTGDVFLAEIPSGLMFCVHDQDKNIGGMVHFSDFGENGLQGGENQIKLLLKEFKASSSQPEHLTVTLLASGHDSPEKCRIVKDSVKSARAMAEAFGLKIRKECIAGKAGLKIRMNTGTGLIQFQVNAATQKKPLSLTRPKPVDNPSKEPAEKTKPQKSGPIKVLIVDDSVMVQKLLNSIFSKHEGFEVFGIANHPLEAEKLLKSEFPDVVTLDMNMPHMDGLTYLKDYLVPKKIPVIMISGVCKEDGVQAMQALEIGAVDFIGKPDAATLSSFSSELTEKVLAASAAMLSNLQDKPKQGQKSLSIVKASARAYNPRKIIAIGSSTGGTQALTKLFHQLPSTIPPIVVVQHIPEHFSKMFADRLNLIFPFTIKEAENNDPILPNQILIAPGGKQMKIVESNGKKVIRITDDEPINRHKPSVDYLYDSIVELYGLHTVGVMLTGMGKDGAVGFKNLFDLGAKMIAQDEQSSVVYGMPKEAARLAPGCEILDLGKIGDRMLQFCSSARSKASA